MSDIDTLLRAGDPAASTTAYSAAERDALLARSFHQSAIPPKRRWRFIAVAAAAAAVVGIAFNNLPTSPELSARADELLTQAAINATDPSAKPDQYWETRMTGTAGDPNDPCQEASLDRTYISVDGSKPSWSVTQNKRPANCKLVEGIEQEAYGSVWAKAPNELAENWYWPSPEFFESLPRDPSELYKRMYADVEQHAADTREGAIYSLIWGVLESGNAPADVRSAMFEVLKVLPGMTVIEETQRDSRPVVIFGLKGDATEQIIIDPSTGEMVGYRVVIAEDNIREGTIKRSLVNEVPADVQQIAEVRNCEIRSGELQPTMDEQLICK